MFWRPRSLRFRYTLRGLLVFITLFMVWGGYHTNRSWKERAAEKILIARGASCEYASPTLGGSLTSCISAIYTRLVQTLWRERLITSVRIVDSLDPATIEAISSLPHLKSLSLSPSEPTAEDVVRMKQRKVLHPTAAIPQGALARIVNGRTLEVLEICGWKLSDSDCQLIARHSGLRALTIDGSSLSEESFADLITKPDLRWFSFRYCDVSGSALAGRSGSPSLESAHSAVAPVGHEFARFIGLSPNVVDVVACHDAVDNEFVHLLGRHPSLAALILVDSNVTDECLADIAQMPALKVVALPRQTVSPEGVARLQRARPTLKIGQN